MGAEVNDETVLTLEESLMCWSTQISDVAWGVRRRNECVGYCRKSALRFLESSTHHI